MADVVYNPLLKRNIQYLGGGSDVDDKIAALQTLLNSLTKDSNGNYVISVPTKFLDNVTVEGTQTVVKTQEIQSENDYIILREGNPLGLAAGAYSGFKIKNYDGNSNNCLLVVDKNGWARIGDESGTIQKIATIEENPTNGQFVKYNTVTKQLESAPITVPNKVTAFFEPDGSDLQPNEIGEYQGTTNATFQEGCFYKRVIIHPVGESTLNVAELHNYSKIESSEIVSNYFSVQSGTYYQQSGVTPIFEEYAMCRAVYKYLDQNWNILFLTQSDDLSDIVVGDWIMINTSTQNNGVDVWDWHNLGTFYIAQISEITRNVVGNITSFKIVGGSNTLTFVDTYGWLYFNSNTLPFSIGNNNYTVYYSDNNKAGILLLPMSNGKFAPIVLAETIGAVETPVTDFAITNTDPVATTTQKGLMSSQDKIKLDNLSTVIYSGGTTIATWGAHIINESGWHNYILYLIAADAVAEFIINTSGVASSKTIGYLTIVNSSNKFSLQFNAQGTIAALYNGTDYYGYIVRLEKIV